MTFPRTHAARGFQVISQGRDIIREIYSQQKSQITGFSGSLDLQMGVRGMSSETLEK